MASTTCLRLLRLPPLLRQETLGHVSVLSRINRINRTPRIWNYANKPTRQFSAINTSFQPSKLNVKRPPKAPPQRRTSRSPASEKPDSASDKSSEATWRHQRHLFAKALLGSNSSLLLYRAPSHGSFTATTLFCGATLILGSMTSFSLSLGSGGDLALPTPLMVKILVLVPTFMMSVIGTTFLVAPTRLVKTITLVASQPQAALGKSPALPQQFHLRFETRPAIPLFSSWPRGKTFEVEPHSVRADFRVRSAASAAELPSALKIRSVSIEEARELTAKAQPGQEIGVEKRSWGQVLRGAPSALVQNVLRMFLRDGFAYLRIEGQGLWKVDLHRSWAVEEARPLAALMVPDPNIDRSILGKVKGLLAYSQRVV